MITVTDLLIIDYLISVSVTIFIIRIWKPQLFTIHALKLEQV